MTFKSGFGSNAKQVIYRLAPTEGEASLYYLTPRQVKALLANTDYLSWINRHQSLPDDIEGKDGLEAWVSNLNLTLMTPIEVSAMDCDDIEDCIEEKLDDPDSDLSIKIKEKLLQDDKFVSDLTDRIVALSPDKLTEIVNPTTECDKDVLWGQCKAIARFTHGTVMDVLQVLEVQTNNVELLRALRGIPFVKAALAIAPVDEGLEFVNWMQEAFIEQYEANWDDSETPDGSIWKIAEELFCLCESDCEITLERIFDAYANLLSGLVSLSWDNFNDFVETIVGVNDNSMLVVYGLHAAMWGFAKFTSFLGLASYDAGIIKLLMKIAEDEADHEWAGIVSCVPTQDCSNFAGQMDGWISYPLQTTQSKNGAGGWYQNEGGGVIIISDDVILPNVITSITVKFNRDFDGVSYAGLPSDYDLIWLLLEDGGGGAGSRSTGLVTTTGQKIVFNATGGTHWTPPIKIQAFFGGFTWPVDSFNTNPQAYLTEICVNED